jgi:hypothetical protein
MLEFLQRAGAMLRLAVVQAVPVALHFSDAHQPRV